MVLALIAGALVMALWLLARAYRHLQADYRLLQHQINRLSSDVAGLCSAAVNVDKRLLVHDQQARHLLEKLDERSQAEQEREPYRSIIDKVKQGASLQDLVEECGIARDEADLLLRLYGRYASDDTTDKGSDNYNGSAPIADAAIQGLDLRQALRKHSAYCHDD